MFIECEALAGKVPLRDAGYEIQLLGMLCKRRFSIVNGKWLNGQ